MITKIVNDFLKFAEAINLTIAMLLVIICRQFYDTENISLMLNDDKGTV